MQVPYLEVQLRLVPACAFVVILLIAALLGLSPTSDAVPVNDKLQHLICFFLLSLSFYWILDVSKKRATQVTTISMIIASIASEYLQAVLTTRPFDPLDILANLIGAFGALSLSSIYHTRMLQRRRAAKYAMLNATRTDDMELGVDIEEPDAMEMDEAPSETAKAASDK